MDYCVDLAHTTKLAFFELLGDSSSATPSRGKDVLEPTARVINAFVDLLEDDEEQEGVGENDKKSLELLREWKGFEIEVNFCLLVFLYVFPAFLICTSFFSNAVNSPILFR